MAILKSFEQFEQDVADVSPVQERVRETRISVSCATGKLCDLVETWKAIEDVEGIPYESKVYLQVQLVDVAINGVNDLSKRLRDAKRTLKAHARGLKEEAHGG